MRLGSKLALVGCGVALLSGGVVLAQNFQTFTLAPGFLPDPTTGSGISGGPVNARRFGPNCSGYVDTTPDHILNLTAPDQWMRIYVSSPGDTTLVVRGPSGVRCADDTFGDNPAVEGPWMPGRYEIYVGSYNAGTNYNYMIGMTELQSYHP